MDPLHGLLKSLHSVFHLEVLRNDKYVFAPIEALKKAVDAYRTQHSTKTYLQLLDAVIAAHPYIAGKWRVNFTDVQASMDALSKQHATSEVDWHGMLGNRNYSPRFHGHAKTESALIPWLEAKLSKPFSTLDSGQKTKVLLEHVAHVGFSKKFNAFLQERPSFLFQLMLDSEQNFMTIAGSRLNLYLTDQQLAAAILSHLPRLLLKNDNKFDQVDKLVAKLNGILSNGRSVATLMRNEDAKAALKQSEVFHEYLSEAYKNRHDAL